MTGTGETTIELGGLHAVGHGVDRPEHVVVGRDGRVFASDKASAVAELIDENTVRRMGQAGGEPNGTALDRDGHFLIANFGSGVLQDLDPVTGEIATILSGQLDGRPLRWLNFVLVDSVGALWCSVSTMTDDLVDTIARGTADGFIFRVTPDRQSAHVVADAVSFPNCMALDRNEDYLYVVRTVAADVVRFRSTAKHSGRQSDSARRWAAGAPTSSVPITAGSWPIRGWVAGGGWPTDARSTPRETSGSHSFSPTRSWR
jgi:sugar lactone lactonase YvrE